jgi:hypothetical protein
MTTSRLIVDKDKQADADDDFFAEAFARIECHYFVNGGFFKYDGQLIQEVCGITLLFFISIIIIIIILLLYHFSIQSS